MIRLMFPMKQMFIGERTKESKLGIFNRTFSYTLFMDRFRFMVTECPNSDSEMTSICCGMQEPSIKDFGQFYFLVLMNFDEIRNCFREDDNKIKKIKVLRILFGLGLKEAKDFVEGIVNKGVPSYLFDGCSFDIFLGFLKRSKLRSQSIMSFLLDIELNEAEVEHKKIIEKDDLSFLDKIDESG